MNAVQSLLKVFESRKMAALLLLGFGAGLPLYLTSRTLQVWMTVEKVDLAAIGLFGLVGLPYSLKFLWSPIIDRFALPFLGRRRGWLIAMQIALALSVAMMAFQQPKQALLLLAINALVVAFFSATQDIAVDAYRTDVLEELELGAGAAVYVAGYRAALIMTLSLAPILAEKVMPWKSVYLLMAALMGVGIIGTLLAPEPKVKIQPPENLRDAVVLPFGEIFQRLGGLRTVLSLGFIVLYKLGDSFLGNMSLPFLLKIGFTQTDVGAIQGGMGLAASIVGVFVGGAILSRIGINRSLWVFGILQAVSNLAYYLLALTGKNYQVMVLAINVEQFCGGLGNAAFLGFLMSLCNPRFSATQFALLSSFMAISRDLLASPGGLIAEKTGWPAFFLISTAAAIPGLLLLPFFAPWNSQPADMPRPGLRDEDEDVWGTK